MAEHGESCQRETAERLGNFDFVRQTLPELFEGCARAESHGKHDPAAACMYARRVVEETVVYLYDILELPDAYRSDLSARINDAAFTSITGVGIRAKLNLIRKLGNNAAHANRPTRHDEGLTAVRELFHVMVWATFHYSQHPDAVPTQAQFDPDLAAKAAPLTPAEVRRLAQRFTQQEKEHEAALAERDQRLEAQDAELAEYRRRLAAAQRAKSGRDDHDYNEAETRRDFIDLDLREAGWTLEHTNDREYKVHGMPNANGIGYVDYVLWGADGQPLAVVEAKRTGKDAHVGQQQAKLYADCMERQFGRRPVVFFTNGHEHWMWDDAAGYPPRKVAGFYTRSELELAVSRRRTRQKLSTAPIDAAIAGRPYQVQALRAIGDAFDRKQREALLVMATGTGKTRTIIALVDQLMAAGWAKRVLFLADRTALVRQAVAAFKEHLPSATTINLLDEKSDDGRVYVSTYPTILNLINQKIGDDRPFGPGYFDLIVIDEAHRSVYAKYGAIFDWFDGMLVGLTATPKDQVDHNTYRLFNLEDGIPTDAYGLDEAVADGYLVPPRGVALSTKFLQRGIRYADLTEDERDEWDALEWGDEEPPVEVSADEVNRFLFNEDTVDKVISTLMSEGHTVAGGDRLGKTIIFAKNQHHAYFIADRFNVAYPELAGHFAQVITHGNPYAQSLIDTFGVTEKTPQIAISVDMLDTGIDVPDVVNLVFFKLVRSPSKFWQMIGRGTRLRPDLYGPGVDKANFLVFDFCGNLEFFNQDLPLRNDSVAKPLAQRLFEHRVGLVLAIDTLHVDAREALTNLRGDTAHILQSIVAGMNTDNVIVRRERQKVEHFADVSAWEYLTPGAATDIIAHLARLPSGLRDDDEDAKRFDLLVLRRQLAQLEGDLATAERARESITAIAEALLGVTTIPAVAEHAELLENLANDEWWVDVTLPMLESARKRVRGLVRFIDVAKRLPVYTDFEDELGDAVAVELKHAATGTDWARFREKAGAYLRAHDDNLALERLRRNKQLTSNDLEELERMLRESGAGDSADLERARSGGLGLFVRQLVGLDRQAAIDAFARYLDEGLFSVDQVRFVKLIIDELTARGVIEPRRLFDQEPYTSGKTSGILAYFPEDDVEIIIGTVAEFTERTKPSGVA